MRLIVHQYAPLSETSLLRSNQTALQRCKSIKLCSTAPHYRLDLESSNPEMVLLG